MKKGAAALRSGSFLDYGKKPSPLGRRWRGTRRMRGKCPEVTPSSVTRGDSFPQRGKPYMRFTRQVSYILGKCKFTAGCRGEHCSPVQFHPIIRNIRVAAAGGIVAVPTDDPWLFRYRSVAGGAYPAPAVHYKKCVRASGHTLSALLTLHS